MLELVAVGNDYEAAKRAAETTGGVGYWADPADDRDRPFNTLVRAVTDDPSVLAPAAGVGLYTVFARVVRERSEQAPSGEASPGVTAVFGMQHRPDLSHAQGDAHWRDTHAPLALKHHPGMWDYTQLSVTATHSGTSFDGFALVAFASVDDMRNRFFGTDHDREVILADIAKFADTERSPRRVVTTEHVFGTRPPTAGVRWAQG